MGDELDRLRAWWESKQHAIGGSIGGAAGGTAGGGKSDAAAYNSIMQQMLQQQQQHAASDRARAVAESRRQTRDMLALEAMKAILIGYGTGGAGAVRLAASAIADRAYEMAEAMLAASEEKP